MVSSPLPAGTSPLAMANEPTSPDDNSGPPDEPNNIPPHEANGAGDPPADQAPAEPTPTPGPDNKRWYVIKVQSGREESIKEAIERRVKIEGLQESFGEIIVPVERVTEVKNGKRVVKERKLYPGYLMANLEFNDRMLYLFRETSGVGDFVGGGVNKPPIPMSDKEVERLLKSQAKDIPTAAETAVSPYEKGDHVKVKDGTFAGMDGTVKDILEQKGALVIELTIFGRPVPVELEYWQVDYA